jgi:hypothetical protein
MVAAARMLRHTPHIGTDLPPDDAVRLDAPDERLAVAETGLDDADFKPVAELLEWSREAAWWEARDRWVEWLARQYLAAPPSCRSKRSWLDAWWDADPGNPDAAVVRAEIAVRQALAAGGAERTDLLREADAPVLAAAEANPNDPVPWRIAITRAHGLRASRAVFEDLWAQAVARSPHHFGCHVSALRHLRVLSAGGGPSEECLDFADEAAASVLPGSLVGGLPLIAAYEYVVAGGRGADRYIDAAIERAQDLSAWHPPGGREPAEVRNVLAQMLILRKRWAAALDQFRAIGAHATRFPWSLTGEPLGEFLEMRTGVRVQLASTIRLSARHGGPYRYLPT